MTIPDTMLDAAGDLGCREAWVLTSRSNVAAMRLYASCGGSEGDADLAMFTFKFFTREKGPHR